MNRVIFHLSHVCFREPIHRSSFTVYFRERVHLSRKHTVEDEPEPIHLIEFIIHFIDSMAFFIQFHVNRFTVCSRETYHDDASYDDTMPRPSNGAVNRFTRTHGREWEP